MNWPKAIIFVFFLGIAVSACGGAAESPSEPAPTSAAEPAAPQPEATLADNPTLTEPQAEEPSQVEAPSPAPRVEKRRPAAEPSPTRPRAPVRTEPAPVTQPSPRSAEVHEPPQAEPAPPANREPVIVPSPPRRPDDYPEVVTVPDDQPVPAPSTVRRDQPVPTRTTKVVLREGTPIEVRVTAALNSSRNQTGDQFEAILDRDLEVDGKVVARRGDRVTGHLEGVEPGGKVKGRAEMTLRLETIHAGENAIALQTNAITIQAESGTVKDAKTVGIATGIGAAIGAIAGGKKGAAIGAAIGGGAGTAKVLTSRGEDASVEKEQLLSFRLEKDVEVSL